MTPASATTTQTERRAPAIADRRERPHLDNFMQLRSGRRMHEQDKEGACLHWPLDGPARIRAVSNAMLELALVWEHTGAHHGAGKELPTGCVDISACDASVLAQIRSLQCAGLPERLEMLRSNVREQVEEHVRTARWLASTARETRAAAEAAGRDAGSESVLSDTHRVVAKDLLAADLNALVERLLRHALQVITHLDLSPAALLQDLLGPRAYGAVMLTTAEMLDRAGTLALESFHFVEDSDRRFKEFREQVVVVAALSRQAVARLIQVNREPQYALPYRQASSGTL